MQEYFFEPRGIYYRKNDWTPDKQTLVFVHGVSASSSAWAKYEEKFRNKYNILSFDLRGHGKSLKYPEFKDYELQNFASDMFELLKELSVGKFVFISHSFGTVVALKFLAEHQDMVKKIIFLSPILGEKKWLAVFLKPVIKIIAWINHLRFSQKPRGRVDYSMYPNSSEWSPKRLYADVRNTGLRVYLLCIEQLCAFDGKEFLKKITAPTLIVHGKEDTYSSVENAFYMALKIKNSELHIMENANHIIVLNNFDEVSNIIENFLKK